MAKDPICGMALNEKSAYRLVAAGKEYFFCSEHCLTKFARDRGIAEREIAVAARRQPKVAIYKNKTLVTAGILAILVGVSFILPVLIPFRLSLFVYVKAIWWAILLGLVLGGMVDYYIPREYISHILAKSKKRTILYSVTLGFLMSACSHGILALAIELHKKGASNPAVISFLLASPWANLVLTIMLIGFFGLKAFYIIISAIAIAITTGLIFQHLERRNLIERNENIAPTQDDFSIIDDIKKRIKEYKFSKDTLIRDVKGIWKGAVSLGNMILWWIIIGTTLASFAGAYVPQNLFQSYMGPTLLGLFVTLALATIIEVCSEGSAPMAFEIFRQTGALGNSFVFLMAGVVTDYTEIGLLWHNVGRKTAIWLPIVTVPQVILLGIIANIIY